MCAISVDPWGRGLMSIEVIDWICRRVTGLRTKSQPRSLRRSLIVAAAIAVNVSGFTSAT